MFVGWKMRTVEEIDAEIARLNAEREELLGWKPEINERYWYPHFTHFNLINNYHWTGDATDTNLYNLGLVFKTKEEAIACAKRMLAAVKP